MCVMAFHFDEDCSFLAPPCVAVSLCTFQVNCFVRVNSESMINELVILFIGVEFSFDCYSGYGFN